MAVGDSRKPKGKMKTLRNGLIKTVSALVPAFAPLAHFYMLHKFWGRYSRRVDKRYCSCSCWDTVFKGTYETGVASYKHMYFNATINSAKIWLLTVSTIIVLYECLKYQLKLLFNGQARNPMFLLFILSLFSHYYSWWVYINYWNDEFYFEWNHQLLFTLSEIISTVLVVHLSNNKVPVTPLKVTVIVTIAFIHTITGGLDQFFNNIIRGEGYTHQVIRDVALVVPDILHVIIPPMEMFKYQKSFGKFKTENLMKNMLCVTVLIIFWLFLNVGL